MVQEKIQLESRTKRHAQEEDDGNWRFDPETLPRPRELTLGEATDKIVAACNVLVMSGSSSKEFPVAGQQIASVRRLLRDALNIDDNAVALVNGRQAPEQTVLNTNDRLEFVKRAGSKGSFHHSGTSYASIAPSVGIKLRKWS